MCTKEEGGDVFQLSGITLGVRGVQRAQWESGALALSREGKVLQKRAEAGFTVVGEERSLRGAICLL